MSYELQNLGVCLPSPSQILIGELARANRGFSNIDMGRFFWKKVTKRPEKLKKGEIYYDLHDYWSGGPNEVVGGLVVNEAKESRPEKVDKRRVEYDVQIHAAYFTERGSLKK